MATEPEALAHQEWLGFVQPVGLVVSVPALLAAQCHVNRNIAPDHARFLDALPRDPRDNLIPELRDFPGFTTSVLGWREGDLEALTPGDPATVALEVPLPEYHETLRPTYVVRDPEPADAERPWMLLVQQLPAGQDLDEPAPAHAQAWQASPQARFERLLRETQVPIGLLCNGTNLRLVYAPRGETNGYLTFSVPEMVQVAGRPIFAALHTLLCEERLFTLARNQRLPAILSESRRYQNEVSNKLADQVFAALCDLLRGFQAANDASGGNLLREALTGAPQHIYHGLLTVLMRLVFLLYAEDRGLISNAPIYTNHYSVTGLFDRLRADAGRYPDTMDQRYGGWAQLLTLFRLIHEGGSHGDFHIPARKGYLFDPNRYRFLEGRLTPDADSQSAEEALPEIAIPRVSDGVVFRLLRSLLILDGERLSYRTLDVEQIGSVYERMMGFELQVADGPSIALKPKKAHGAPTTVNLEALLAVKPADRGKWLKSEADQELSGQAATALKEALSVGDLLVALDRRIAKTVTQNVVPRGALVFQPSPERRRSGSHYTPRSLTEPIVGKTLEPILTRLGPRPTPEQLLDLKVCDPAMGSGAFLVEACRQLGDALVKAWHAHNCLPKIPPDEDEVLHARRLIAQRCLYGVDKNPMATDLAKLSLWLATLAKGHPFTFLDHSLRTGDSLVGLNKEQIAGFHWQPSNQQAFLSERLRIAIDGATAHRREILAARDDVPYEQLEKSLARAERALSVIRFIGDVVVAGFFSGGNPRARETRRLTLVDSLEPYLSRASEPARRQLSGEVENLRNSGNGIVPFHWHIELPEVFERRNSGFDGIIGNPPFAGKNTIASSGVGGYLDWLKSVHAESHGNADLVAHFFRRAFTLIRLGGSFGMIATNTIGQGDTRSTGLRWICTHGGEIYHALKRVKWPGEAAVVVSIVNLLRGSAARPLLLDGKEVPIITAYLFHAGGHEDPRPLCGNNGKSFQGPIPLGMGFTFDDTDTSGTASSICTMRAIIKNDPRNADRIFPYIGGDELLNHPTQEHHRYIINFGDMSEDEAQTYPELFEIVTRHVKPHRITDNRESYRKYWWQFAEKRGELNRELARMDRTLAHPFTASYLGFTFVSSRTIVSGPHCVITFSTFGAFACLQSRVHERWATFFGSSLEDRQRYTTSDCFATFPFPHGAHFSQNIEKIGQEYYEFRAALMVREAEGVTRTYHRFHDPDERSPDILKLRELHAEMDRAVLEAYGWRDLAETSTCEFLLDYEEDEDEESIARRRKKPWRYRWPDEFRDEVLARLLELNRVRAEEERLAALATAAAEKTPTRKRRKATPVGQALPGFEGE